MITFKIQGKSFPFPTTWHDTTYEQYLFHIVPRTVAESIHCFTGIPVGDLVNATIKNVDKIHLALIYMTMPPNFERTAFVGKYLMPTDPVFESVGQFEDLRNTIKQLPQKPRNEYLYDDLEQESDAYLQACAIYCQKIRDGVYNADKVASMKEELKKASCVEVISNGAFFLAKALHLSTPLRTRFQRVIQHLKRLIVALPGYRKTLDFLQRSTASPGK